jgi:hypothetical protein
MFSQALYLQSFSCLEKSAQLVLGNVDLDLVHVLEKRLHVHIASILQNHHWVLAGIFPENCFEVCAAC